MKKRLLSILLASVFLMSSCAMASEETTAETDTAETTTVETTMTMVPPAQEIHTVFTSDARILLIVSKKDDTRMWRLIQADCERLCEVLNRAVWENCVIEIDLEYAFKINDIELEYSPAHGMIFDRKNQRRIRLSTQDRSQIDDIVNEYGTQVMTLKDIGDLLIYGEGLRWSNLAKYRCSKDVGFGFYVLRYPINPNFYLFVGGGDPLEDDPLSYAHLVWKEDESLWVDIRTMRSLSELIAYFTLNVLPEGKVAFMKGWDSPWSCLTDEDAELLCEIVNRGEWVDAEEPDDYYSCYFDFLFFSTVYYPQYNMLWDFDNDRALFLSEEDAQCVDEMMAVYGSLQMTLDDIRGFSEKGNVTWSDLAFFDGRSTGSGMAGAIYSVDENYTATVWASHDGRSMESVRMYLDSQKDNLRINIFEVDMDKFLSDDHSVSYDIDYELTGNATFSRRKDDETNHFVFYQADAERLCDLFDRLEWFVGIDLKGIFTYDLNFGDYNFRYEPETGILNDTTSMRTAKLREEEKAIIDEILSVYGVRTMTLDDVRALAKKSEITWADIMTFNGTGGLTMIYVINESFYVEIKGELGVEIESAYLCYGKVYNWKERTNLLTGSSVDWFIRAYGMNE